MSCEGSSIGGIGSSRSDAFARWGTLPPPSSAPATSSADEAHPRVPPSRPSRPEAHAASFTAVGVGRGTVVAGGAVNSVSLVAPPRVGAGNVAPPAPPPEKSQQLLSVTADRRASKKLSSCTTAMSSSGHGAPPLIESCPFFPGHDQGHRDARTTLSSSRHSPFPSGGSGVDAADSDALLARLAGKAKQAAAVALSASRAGTTTPVPTMSLDDGLEKKQSFTGLSVTEVDAGVVGVTDAGGGLRAAVGKGGCSGARLAHLCKEDKAKVARLMQDLAKLRSEKDMQKARFERLRAQNEAIVKEVSSLRVKFGQSMQLLRKYQNIVKEGEIAGGRAASVDTSDGFGGETPAGSGPTGAAAAEEIRSLREALQAAERRSEKAESEAAADRIDREKMAEELRNMEADNSELRRQLKLHPAAAEGGGVLVGEGTVNNPPLVAKASSSTSIYEGCSGGGVEAGGGARQSDHERVATEKVVGAAQTPPLADGGGMGSDGVQGVVSAAAVSALQEQVEMLKQQLVMVGVRQLALTGLPLGPPAVWDRARDPEPSEALNPSRGVVSQSFLSTLPDGVDCRYRGHCQETNASAPERSIGRAVDGVSRAGSGIVGVRSEGEEAVMLSGRGADGLEQEQQRGLHVVKGVWGGGEEGVRKEGMDDGSWRREERQDDNSGSGIRRTVASDIEEAVEGSRARLSDGLMVVGDEREVGNSGGGTAQRHGPESSAERIPRGRQRSDGQIRRGSKGLAPSHVFDGGSLADGEDGSLSQGRLTAGSGSGAIRRPRTWFEAASDRLSCEGGVEGLEWRRRSDAVVDGVDDEVRLSTDDERDRDCRIVNVQRRRRGLASDYLLEEEAMGSCQPGGSSSSGQEKLRVSWGSVSVHSGDTETDRGRLGSVNARSGRGRDSAKSSGAGGGEEQRGNAEARTRASKGYSRDPAVWSPLEPSRRHRDGVRRPPSPENRGTASDGIGTAAVSTRTACRLPSKERKEYSTGSGVATSTPCREKAPTARDRVKPDPGLHRHVAGVVGWSRGDGKRKDRTRRCHAGEGLGTSEERGFFDGDLLDLIDDIEEEDDMHGRRSERASGARPPPYRAPQTRPSTVSYPATRTARKSGDHRRDCEYGGGVLERPGTVMGYSKR